MYLVTFNAIYLAVISFKRKISLSLLVIGIKFIGSELKLDSNLKFIYLYWWNLKRMFHKFINLSINDLYSNSFCEIQQFSINGFLSVHWWNVSVLFIIKCRYLKPLKCINNISYLRNWNSSKVFGKTTQTQWIEAEGICTVSIRRPLSVMYSYKNLLIGSRCWSFGFPISRERQRLTGVYVSYRGYWPFGLTFFI